jgi:hypothetical protein
MSIYVYVTRKPDPLETTGPDISAEEWHELVASDPDILAAIRLGLGYVRVASKLRGSMMRSSASFEPSRTNYMPELCLRWVKSSRE